MKFSQNRHAMGCAVTYRRVFGVLAVAAAVAASGGPDQAWAQKSDAPQKSDASDAAASEIANVQTLSDILALTYMTNPTLEAQRAAVRGTDEELPQALSNWRPTITINGSASASETVNDLPGGSSRTDSVNQSVDLSVSQPIFRGFRTLNQTARARHDIDAARANLTTVEQNILLAAVEAYTAVVRDAAVVALSRNNERVLERQLDAADSRFEVGELTRTDVAQAQSRLASATANRVAAEGELIASKAVFAEVIGLEPEQLHTVEPPAHIMPEGLEDAVASARSRNPSVRAARSREAAAQENIDVIQGELLPSVSINGVLRESNQSSGPDTETTSGSVTANLRVPLYQSGAVYSRIRQARQIASQRLLELAGSEREAVRLATENWERFQTATARIVSFTAEVEAQQTALDGVTQEALVGARTVLDELDAEQELFNAQVNLVQARRDEVVAAYRLLSAMGSLTAEHLELPVVLYNPADNLARVDGLPFSSGGR